MYPPPPEFGLLRLLSEALRAGGVHWRGGLVNQLENSLAYTGQPNNFGSGNDQRSAVAMAQSCVLKGLHPSPQDGSDLNLDGQN